jgi:ProP effector
MARKPGQRPGRKALDSDLAGRGWHDGGLDIQITSSFAMMDNAPEKDITSASAAPSSPQEATAAAVAPAAVADASQDAAAPAVAADAPDARERTGNRRGGRGGRNRRQGGAGASSAQDPAADGAASAAPQRAPRAIPPALETLAGLYPHLFGAVFRPLKRGVFQDLLAAHPEAFEREELKTALGIHTRSTRYLQSVAAGEKRFDLQGQPVEAMAPEHVHHALLEVYRRRKARASDDLLPKLRNRMMAAFEASELSREDYTALVTGRDEAANAILEEAFSEWAARNAKDEALLRAFEASGQTLEAFADMYGMVARTVGQQLDRARRVAAAAAAQAAEADSAPAPAAEAAGDDAAA